MCNVETSHKENSIKLHLGCSKSAMVFADGGMMSNIFFCNACTVIMAVKNQNKHLFNILRPKIPFAFVQHKLGQV